MEDGDIWWHLRTGQLIWQRGEIPRTDWFTYTNPDAPWIDLHWGFQLLAAGLWSVGGSAALILTKAAIGVITLGIAMSIEKRGWSKAVTVACWLIPVLIFVGRFYVRPEILTLLFLACTLAILYHASKKPWLIWLLPLVQVCWVNMQGLFVLQFVVIGCFALDQVFRHLTNGFHDGDPPRIPMRGLLIASGTTFLASLLNPYGLRGALFPVTLFEKVGGSKREFFFNFAGELEGVSEFIEKSGVSGLFLNITTLCLIELTLGILISFLLLWQFRRFDLYHLLIAVGFAYLAWQMNRNSVLYAIVGGMVFRLNIGQWWDLKVKQVADERKRKKHKQESRLPFVEHATKFRAALAIILVALIISVPIGIYHKLRPTLFNRQFGLGQSQWYPHSGAEFLKDHPDLPDRVYASHLGVAAVCIFHVAPEKKIFADPRLETNTPETLQAHQQILERIAGGGDYRSLLQGKFTPTDSDQAKSGETPAEMPVIILDNKTLVQIPSIFARLKDDKWRCIFFDDNIVGNFQGSEQDMKSLENGCAVFLMADQADKLKFPAADTTRLESLIELYLTASQQAR